MLHSMYEYWEGMYIRRKDDYMKRKLPHRRSIAICLLYFIPLHPFFSFKVVERAAQSSASKVCSLSQSSGGVVVPFPCFVSRPVGIFLRFFSRAFGVTKHLRALEKTDTNRSSPVALLANDAESDETSQAIWSHKGSAHDSDADSLYLCASLSRPPH